MNLRCYCCGEAIQFDARIALVSLRGDEVDRVFIMKPEHVTRVEDASTEVVRRQADLDRNGI